jgi:hypothetical protein
MYDVASLWEAVDPNLGGLLGGRVNPDLPARPRDMQHPLSSCHNLQQWIVRYATLPTIK